MVKIFKNFFIKIGKFFLFLILSVTSLTLFLFIYYAKDLPRPELFSEREITQSTKIYDRTGKNLLYEIYGEEKRTYVPLEKIPDYLKKAVIAAEDSNFYEHFGVDFKGIIRAVLEDLKLGKPLYGGSTIPQQLIRSTFLTPEKTIARKTKEVILAIELDLRYSKNQILEWYLNQIPFGENAYGVEAASQTYFGKPVSEISLPEAAILASLIKAPYRLSPYDEEGKTKLLERKDYILERMEKLGFISKEDLEKAKGEKIVFKEKKGGLFAPYFVLWIKKMLIEKYGDDFLQQKGLKVYTSLDVEIQKIAQEVVKQGIERNKNFSAYNSCLVAIDPRNGEVLAMTVGKGNYFENPFPENCTPGKNCKFDPKVNVCFSLRQPGSAFKPFIYAEAFKKGYDDKFLVLDEFTNFGVWGDKEYTPKNYDGKFRGWVTLRQSLAQSLNVPSIKILYLVGSDKKFGKLGINNFKGEEKVFLKGLEKSLGLVKELGITTLNKPLSFYGPSIVLGGGEVSLFEMTLAYGAFANGGFKVIANPILKIEDSEGNVIYQSKKPQIRVIEKKVVDLITDILSDNEVRAPMFGEKSYLYLENYKVAAKTGTTQNFKDGWTIGYVPSLVVGVWVGNNDGSPMLKQPGVVVAGPIWHNFLEKVLLKREANSF
jgi:penicillin-binding protein 1A